MEDISLAPGDQKKIVLRMEKKSLDWKLKSVKKHSGALEEWRLKLGKHQIECSLFIHTCCFFQYLSSESSN